MTQPVDPPIGESRAPRLDPSSQTPFHIVGIGASAGGLEALEKLFDEMPLDLGVAFVVVQHLSPDFESHMEDLLGRHTNLAIHRVTDGVRVEPNSIYLIPPKKEMAIREGRLLLTDKNPESGLSHPIDHFFRSLAENVGEKSVGVVLSGTGSDGSRGIADIRDAGGLVIAQDETSAKFDGMPLAAVASGAVHLVLAPDQIAEALTHYVRNGLSPDQFQEDSNQAVGEQDLGAVLRVLRNEFQLDFGHYKKSTVSRRVQRRLTLKKTDTVEAYLELLEEDAEERIGLLEDLLIGVTRFFRDFEAFELLRKEIIPALLRDNAKRDTIRVWVSGCATGEEAYSLGILFLEALADSPKETRVKIFATDVHRESLAKAALGIYSEEALAEMSRSRRERFFREARGGYQVVPELRQMIVFAPHNVISDAPFTQLQLVTCRNLLIYLQPPAQKKALSLFHFGLQTGGILFLGPSESPGEIADEFEVIDKCWKVYRKRRSVRLPAEMRLPLGSPDLEMPRGYDPGNATSTPTEDKQTLWVYDRLLEAHLPTSFLIDENYHLLHTFGGAERYLRHRSGRVSFNLLDNLPDDARTPIASAVQHALRDKKEVSYAGLSLRLGGDDQRVRLTVEPHLHPRTKVIRLLIRLEPEESPVPKFEPGEEIDLDVMTRERIESLETELRYTKENLQATIEELEAANEEMQASNEELVASNEELQSTNEELHSVNEELYSVNSEHQKKIDQLTQAHDDMDNLLAATNVGVIFLDAELRIRWFTPAIAGLFHLLPHDIGRPIASFSSQLDNFDANALAQKVFEEGLPVELESSDRQGRTYLTRALPYQASQETAGVVFTLIDISSVAEQEAELLRLSSIVEHSEDSILDLDLDGTIRHWNRGAELLFGFPKSEIVGKHVRYLSPPNTVAPIDDLLARAGRGESVRLQEATLIRQDGSSLHTRLTVSPVRSQDDSILGASIIVHDVTEQKQAEAAMRLRDRALESVGTGMLITDARQPDNPIIYANDGFSDMTGYSTEEILGRNCRFLQGPETNQENVALIRKAIHEERPCRITLLNYRKDGTSFWNNLTITPVFDESQQLTHFVGVQIDVTDQVRVEEALRDSEGRIRTLLDSTAEAVYGVDRDGLCTFCNPACVEMLGYTTGDELIGRDMHDLIHHHKPDGEPYPHEDCHIFKAFRAGTRVHSDEEVFWRANGTSFPVEYWSHPVSEDGNITGAVVTFFDITQRRQAEQAIREAQERLEISLAAGNMGTWEWNLETDEAVGDPLLMKLFGLSEDTVLTGKLFESLVHAEDRPRIQQAVRDAINHDREYNVEFRLVRPDQSIVWLAGKGRVLRDRQNRAARMTGVNFDITEAKRAERELKRAKRWFERLTQATPDILTVYNVHRDKGVYFNREANRILGYSLEELEGLEPGLFQNLCHPEDYPKTKQFFDTLVRSGSMDVQETVHRLRHKNGEYLWIHSRAVPFRRSAGGVVREVLTVARDITDTKRFEESLRRAKRAAEDANQSKSEFLANMSHEIRTPMTAILGYTDLLVSQSKDPSTLESLFTIKRNGQFLVDILNDILDLSKIEAGKLSIDLQPCSPIQIISEVYSLMLVRAQDKGLKFEVVYDGFIPATIRTDPTRLRQILVNLIGNAIKFTDEGFVRLTVRLFPNEHPLLVFSIDDSGIGMNEQQQGRIFQAFAQGDMTVSRRYGGTGLGLTICKRLVETLGGSIEVESAEGQGSSFRVSIATGPLDDVELMRPEGTTSSVAPTRSALTEYPKLKSRILVVDDNEEIRILLEQLFARTESEVLVCENGQEALALVEKTKSDGSPLGLVILDMHMPVLDGYLTATKLRAQGFAAPILALTADAVKGSRQRCFQAGCTDYLTKPIDIDKLIQATENLIRESREGSPEDAIPDAIERILLVDDNEDAARVQAMLLEMAGYQVEVALNGTDALSHAPAFDPQVVLLDIQLPDIDGYEVLTKMRTLDGFGRVKFIALSGHTNDDDIAKSLAAGFEHHAVKPLDVDDLVRLINRPTASS